TTLAFLIKLSKRLWYICLCSLISSSFIYMIGIPYFIILTNHASHYFSNNIIHTLLNIINVFVLPYIIGDIIKAGIAILVARQFHDLKTKINFYN
ncbi:biotin transporter BioY, partial [Francisella tularensis]|uniref:biotin transporter BioY n=1 Tax=Francisella tularensis TaxID=263 RepID=UPI00174DF3CA